MVNRLVILASVELSEAQSGSVPASLNRRVQRWNERPLERLRAPTGAGSMCQGQRSPFLRFLCVSAEHS